MCKRRGGYGDWSRRTTNTTKMTKTIRGSNIENLSLPLHYFVIATRVKDWRSYSKKHQEITLSAPNPVMP
jgi:hypothetical protein